ncbi:MAG: hypothetical protein AB1781_11070 [Pseudomonadota bacterium]
MLDWLLCKLGMCRRLILIDEHAICSSPIRCIRCGKLHDWITPSIRAEYRKRIAWRERGGWMED